MLVYDGCLRIGANIPQVAVHQDIAKPADLSPGNIGLLSFQCVRQLLRGFRQSLKVAQSRVVQHLILGQIT